MTEGNDTLSNTTDCPSCGIPVTFGYPKCPKCHAAMPNAKRSSAAGPSAGGPIQGGTSVVEEGNNAIWIAVVAGLAVAGGGAFFLLRGNGNDAAKPTAPVAAPKAADDAVDQPTVDTSARTARAKARLEKTPSSQKRLEAVSLIEQELQKRNLWSTVEATRTSLEVRSKYCADAALGQVIDSFRGQLADAGIEIMRCQELHGELAWERPVRGPPPTEPSGGDDDGAGEPNQ